MARKGIAIGLVTICVVWVASLAGTFAYYVPIINEKNNMISSQNTQISQLNSNVTSLQDQIKSDNTAINSLTSNITTLQDQINSLQSQMVELQKNASSQNATIANLQNQLASDNSTICSLMSNITTLQEMLSNFLNQTPLVAWVDLDELQAELYANNLTYVNRTVAVEGNLTGPLVYIPENMPPWNYEWVNPDGSLNNVFGVHWLVGNVFDSTHIIVIGVVKEGRRAFDGRFLPAFFIEAERIIVL